MPLAHILEVNALTLEQSDGPELSATWSWPSALLSEEAVRDLAQGWFGALEALVGYAAQPGAGGHTPSDFSLVTLSQAEIEQLEANYPNFKTSCRSRPCRRVYRSMLFTTRRDRISTQSKSCSAWKGPWIARGCGRPRRRCWSVMPICGPLCA